MADTSRFPHTAEDTGRGSPPRMPRWVKISAIIAAILIALFATVIVPLALTALVTGIIQSLATPWGLVRHYWVVVSLLLTVFATAVLLLERQPVTYLAERAAAPADPRGLPGTLLHSIGGLVILLTVTALNMYKPRGLTRHGWRKQHAKPERRPATPVG